jgi:hypothetical protein
VSGAVTNAYTSNCSAPFQEIYVAEFFWTNDVGVDMVLGRLESRPMGIAPIPADPAFVPHGGEAITMAGWGYTGLCIQTGDSLSLRTKASNLPSNPAWSACCFAYNGATIDVNGCVSGADASRWAIGNLYDSGAPILVNTTVNGQTRVRVIGIVTTQATGITAAAWNTAGGQPRLPLPGNCTADFNNSGSVTVQDVFDFLAAFFNDLTGGGRTGDVNGDGAVTVQDVFDYVRAYFSGCQ